MNKRILYISFSILFLLTAIACDRSSEGSKKASLKITKTTTALYETDPVTQSKLEDAADDPAIWFNSEKPEESKVIGTDKKGGLAVYNLQGKQLFFYPDGNMNNVDIRYDFILGEDTVDLVCASNRSTHSISIYSIQEDGQLTNVSAQTIKSGVIDDVYGFAMYKSPVTKKIYAYINSKAGEVEQWELFAGENSKVDAKKVRAFNLKTQVEGMVADDENQIIFIGEEVAGIWKFDAEPDGSTEGKLLDKSTQKSNPNIVYDIEGLSIYFLPNGDGYLLASSQGNYSYAVYNRKAPHEYIGSFRVTDGQVDGIEETDGIDIFSYALNEDFKHGLFIAQDGYNHEGDKGLPQNFKYVQWEKIANLFDPPLAINPQPTDSISVTSPEETIQE